MKKALSLVMAFAMAISLVPAAFAAGPAEEAPDTIDLPNGDTYVVQDLSMKDGKEVNEADLTLSLASLCDEVDEDDSDSTIPAAGYDGEGTSASPYRVYTAQGLLNLAENFESTNLVVSYIYLMNDLDMSTVNLGTKDYVFKYFAGVIQTDPSVMSSGVATIRGLPEGTDLIYCWVMGALGYFDFDLAGKASQISFLPASVGGTYYNTSMINVNVRSTNSSGANLPVVLPTGDGWANYAPFVYTTAGNFSMTNCTNYASITGSSYGSIFYGYYPFDTNGTYTFTNCVNKGVVTMRDVAMFFGNNTVFAYNSNSDSEPHPFAFNADDVTQNRIQFSGCSNEGSILGTQNAHLFCTRAASDGYAEPSQSYENYLLSENGLTEKGTLEVVNGAPGMVLYSDSQGNLTMTASTSDSVDHYVVSVYSYINIYTKTDSGYIQSGTTRYGTQQTLSNGNTTIDVKKYGICDYGDETEGVEDVGTVNGLYVVSYNGQNYYWLNRKTMHGDYYYGVLTNWSTTGATGPDIVTLAAYSADGTLLGTVSDTPVSAAQS